MQHSNRSEAFQLADAKSPVAPHGGNEAQPHHGPKEVLGRAGSRRKAESAMEGLLLLDRRRRRSVGSVELARHKASSGHTTLDEAVISRLRNLATEGAHGGSPKKDRSLGCSINWKPIALASALGMALLLFLLPVYLAFRRTVGAKELAQSSYCNSAACNLLAAAVLSRLNRSVHPCHDIEAHVCSHLRWGSGLAMDTPTDMVAQWQTRGAAYLETKRKPEAAFALYRACMEPSHKGISDLRAFMRQRGLLWPEYGSTGRHALYVVLDLVINWGVPFWFELSLRKLPNETRYSICFTYVKTMDKWQKRQRASADVDSLLQYAKDLHNVFHASEESRDRIPQLLKLESHMDRIIRAEGLSEGVQGDVLTVLKVPIALATTITPNISTDTWLAYLNEFLSPHRVQATDNVLVDDVDLALSMNQIFGDFSNDDVLYTLGWWFAQHFAVFASLDGGLASYGSMSLAQSNRPMDCYALTESRFRRQLFAERTQASLGKGGMRQAAQLLAHIRNTTAALLRLMPWFDEEAREEAVAIVEATQFEPWTSEFRLNTAGSSLPPRRGPGKRREAAIANAGKAASFVFTTPGNLIESSQATIPSAGGDQGPGDDAEGTPARTSHTLFGPHEAHQFTEALARSPAVGDGNHERATPFLATAIEHWTQAAVQYKSTFPNWPLDDSLLHRHLSPALLGQYNYWWNSLFLKMAAFAEPLFYLDAWTSANYGGLGYLFARYLVSAFDETRGTLLDVERKRRDWINRKSRQAYQRKINCTGGDSRVLTRVAALEIALAAFHATANERGGSSKERDERHSFPGVKEAFSSEMLFFLVYCRVTCGSPLHCGEVLKHVELFGAVFQCPKESKMTSSTPKCSFFGD